MGKLNSFKIEGFYLFFNSHDHLPAHFHVNKSGKWEIRVFFLLSSREQGLIFEMKYGRHPPSSKEQKEILEMILKHRDLLLKEWETKVCIKEKF